MQKVLQEIQKKICSTSDGYFLAHITLFAGKKERIVLFQYDSRQENLGCL
jgi:hypothetical protein